MGSDKALLEVAGVALWQRQRDVLIEAGAAEVFLSARSDQGWTSEVRGFRAVVSDDVIDGGPLAGIAAALERAQHSHLAVLAVDLPRMEPAWFTALLAECDPEIGVVGRRGGFFEPLAAIYPHELLPRAREALQRRELSLQHLIAAACARGTMRVHEISRSEAAIFENWNDPSRT
jgi:molybdopterin-guanine dinucleotide biosynthesis protein A